MGADAVIIEGSTNIDTSLHDTCMHYYLWCMTSTLLDSIYLQTSNSEINYLIN